MTILPGQVEPTDLSPGDRRKPPRGSTGISGRTLAMVVALVVLVAGGGFEAYRLTAHHAAAPAPAPVVPARPSHRVHHVGPLAPHVRVTKAGMLAAAAPVFAALDRSVGSWPAHGRIHLVRDHQGGASGAGFANCLGPAAPHLSGVRGAMLASPNYVSDPFFASGFMFVFQNATVARRVMRLMTGQRAFGCMKAELVSSLSHGQLGRTNTVVAAHRFAVRGVRPSFGLHTVAGFVVNGSQLAIEVDALMGVSGRTMVMMTAASRQVTFGRGLETHALRAMLAQVRTESR